MPDAKSKHVPQPVASVRRVEVGSGKSPTQTSMENMPGRTREPKERSLDVRDERHRTAERRELQPGRHGTIPDVRSTPVGYSRGDYNTREKDALPPPEPRSLSREPRPADDRAFKVPDAKRPRLDEYPRDKAVIPARHQETDGAGRVTERPSGDFGSTGDAMDVFHRLLRIPPDQLLVNEKYVLKEV